jgi:hypothetical protein
VTLQKATSKLNRTLLVLVLVVTAPLWLALVVVAVLVHAVWEVALYLTVWFWWIGHNRRRTIFVYSDSPNWKEYIDRVILPRLPENSVVLNWSNRGQWPRFAVPVLLFRTFAGRREFNPIALVFERFGLVGRYRFWQPFRDLKHGKPEALRMLEERFFAHVAG